MPIRLKCSCGATLSVNEEREGSEVSCPKCRAPLLIAGGGEEGDEQPTPTPGNWVVQVMLRAVLLGLAMALMVVLVYLMFRRG